jgi:hypothetical protein
MAKIYSGCRATPEQKTLSDVMVLVATDPTVVRPNMHPLKHIVRHSPTGFEWGYGGSGPADLALSILTDVFGGRVELADLYYMEFKFEFVAGFDDSWTLTGEKIDEWLKQKTGRGIEELKRQFDALDEDGRLEARFSRKL